jgi:hypothetical protein
MYPDFKELLSVLNEHQAKYLVVGAYALSIHAQPRATKDLDILVKPDAENAKAVFTALAVAAKRTTSATASSKSRKSFFFPTKPFLYLRR